MLMLSVFVVFTYVGGKGRKREQWGLGKGTKNGAVDFGHGASTRAEVRSYVQRATIPSKMFIPYINYS
jgi:hypothetical protein